MTREERIQILRKVDNLVQRKYFDPNFNGRNWSALITKHKESIVAALNDEDFERELNGLLAELGTSHTHFFGRHTRVPSRNSINATFRAYDTPNGRQWLFQDVQPGGPADRAGVKPGDILLAINDHEIIPPQQPQFRMAAEANLTLIHRNGASRQVRVNLATPRPKYSECPYAEPQNVVARRLDTGVGHLKVTLFPGIIGVDFAHDVDRAMAQIKDCSRLIVDLRGNPGGGIGGLRLMSYLTPARIPVGYSLTRFRAERGYRREELPQLRGIPEHKWELPFLALRFGGRDQSIVVVTEGRGPQTFHGRIVILVNEHTAGAGEMVTAFVRENRLGTIVGNKTAGRLLSGKGYKVGHGYILLIPIACYLSWEGHRFEGNGVIPDIPVDWLPETASSSMDNQLARALEVVRSL